MNKTFALITLLGLAATPVMAAETTSTDTAKTPVAAEKTVAPAVAKEHKMLKDGTKVLIKGDEVFTIKDHKKTPIADGTYDLKDGSKLTAKGGKLVK